MLCCVDVPVRLVRQVSNAAVVRRAPEAHRRAKAAHVDMVVGAVPVCNDVDRHRSRLRAHLRRRDLRDEDVMAGAKRHDIETVAAHHLVVACTGNDAIVAGIARQHVVRAVADQDVVAAAAGRILDHDAIGDRVTPINAVGEGNHSAAGGRIVQRCGEQVDLRVPAAGVCDRVVPAGVPDCLVIGMRLVVGDRVDIVTRVAAWTP